jgi:hypothetical protein
VRVALAFVLVGCTGPAAKSPPTPPPPASPPGELRSAESFASIADPSARSKALFLEASKVLLHPRCVNCHPSDDSPRQGDVGQLHDPPVTRGDDHGVPGLRCDGCHQDKNLALARVPGAPKWSLAPKSMAWQGRSIGAICAQIKDTTRNGGKSLAQIVEHSAHDPLVAWGWAPGHERTPAPGTQAAFGALMKAWADSGAVCPEAP